MTEDLIIVKCPHCNGHIIIEQVNCAIFRHGTMKTTNQQIDPHLSKEECDKLVETNSVNGCAKPFIIKQDATKQWMAELCDYI